MILELENNVHLSPNIDESGRFKLKSLTFNHNPESNQGYGKKWKLTLLPSISWGLCDIWKIIWPVKLLFFYFRKGFCVKFKTFQKFQHSVTQSSDHKVKHRFRHGEYNTWAP